jgi:hypothetical protein
MWEGSLDVLAIGCSDMINSDSVHRFKLNFSLNQAPPKIVLQPRDNIISLKIYEQKQNKSKHIIIRSCKDISIQ